jgi:hypothetical protein
LRDGCAARVRAGAGRLPNIGSAGRNNQRAVRRAAIAPEAARRTGRWRARVTALVGAGRAVPYCGHADFRMRHPWTSGRRLMPVFVYLLKLVYKGVVDYIPRTRFGDKLYAIIIFLVRHERLPSDRMLLNDVLYRIKTTDEILDPLRVFVSDKEYVKMFIADAVGESYTVPTLGIIEDVRQVRRFDFPGVCCIKATHTSGHVILRKGGEALDFDRMERWFTLNYYHAGREANYKHLRPKIIVEQLLYPGTDFGEYYLTCYNGAPRMLHVSMHRGQGIERALFDCTWRELDYSIVRPREDHAIERPATFDEMLEVAQALSAPVGGLVRVDMYSDGQTVFVGEITNVSHNAIAVFVPRSAEVEASRMIFS